MKQKGFTLIELLVVIAIIGILAAIAIPQFAEYRKRAFDARSESDLRNAMTAEEAYFVDNLVYTGAQGDLEEVGLSVSSGVLLSLTLGTSGASWDGSTCHPSGNRTYSYDNGPDGSGAIIPEAHDCGA